MIKVGRIVVVYLFEQHIYLLGKSNFIQGLDTSRVKTHRDMMGMKRSRNFKAKEVGGESFCKICSNFTH